MAILEILSRAKIKQITNSGPSVSFEKNFFFGIFRDVHILINTTVFPFAFFI